MIIGDCNVCINGKLPSYSATCVECGLSRKNYKPMTNGDRIRRMTDEELAEFLLNRDLDVVRKASRAVGFIYKVDRELCLVNVIDWLKREVSEKESAGA